MRNDDDNDLSLARFCSGCLAQSLRPGGSSRMTISRSNDFGNGINDVAFRPRSKVPVDVSRPMNNASTSSESAIP